MFATFPKNIAYLTIHSGLVLFESSVYDVIWAVFLYWVIYGGRLMLVFALVIVT